MTIYKLTFLKPAYKEWNKLDPDLQKQLKMKLAEILENPLVPKNKLSGLEDCYKVKLRAAGYRLVYRVKKQQVIIQVIAIGKRDRQHLYRLAQERL